MKIYEDIAVEFYGDNTAAETVKKIHTEWMEVVEAERKIAEE